MTREEQIEALISVALNNDWTFQSYSGRFMYGANCPAIVGRDPNRIIEKATKVGVNHSRTDNMGLDYVVYWPEITLLAGEDQIDGEDDE